MKCKIQAWLKFNTYFGHEVSELVLIELSRSIFIDLLEQILCLVNIFRRFFDFAQVGDGDGLFRFERMFLEVLQIDGFLELQINPLIGIWVEILALRGDVCLVTGHHKQQDNSNCSLEWL